MSTKQKYTLVISLFILVLFPFSTCVSQNIYLPENLIKIRLFGVRKYTKLTTRVEKGEYIIIALDKQNNTIDTIQYLPANTSDNMLFFDLYKNRIRLRNKNNFLGLYDNLKLVPTNNNSNIFLKYGKKENSYIEEIDVSIEKNYLLCVNKINLEKYVEGVVEAESGHFDRKEYLKVQAIIARSYALKNINKYHNEKFHLLDNVSCQVFNGRARFKNQKVIKEAVKESNGMIILDSNDLLVETVFHANSGGYTANAEDVWSNNVPYLRSKEDIFSYGQSKSHWEKEFTIKEYLAFYKKFYPKLYKFLEENKGLSKLFKVPQNIRTPYFEVNGEKILYLIMRKYFKLRSTFFSIVKNKANIKLVGRGFGHGLGVSQEGAEEMVRQGYNYLQVIYFYYKDVKVKKIY